VPVKALPNTTELSISVFIVAASSVPSVTPVPTATGTTAALPMATPRSDKGGGGTTGVPELPGADDPPPPPQETSNTARGINARRMSRISHPCKMAGRIFGRQPTHPSRSAIQSRQ